MVVGLANAVSSRNQQLKRTYDMSLSMAEEDQTNPTGGSGESTSTGVAMEKVSTRCNIHMERHILGLERAPALQGGGPEGHEESQEG